MYFARVRRSRGYEFFVAAVRLDEHERFMWQDLMKKLYLHAKQLFVESLIFMDR